MTWILLLLSGFILNPSRDGTTDPHKKQITEAVRMMEKYSSGLVLGCKYNAMIWLNGNMAVIDAVCTGKEKDSEYKARFWIDYKNKVRMKRRFYEAMRK